MALDGGEIAGGSLDADTQAKLEEWRSTESIAPYAPYAGATQSAGDWFSGLTAYTGAVPASGKRWTLLVSYRGIWCPYCKAYLRELTGLNDEIVAAGGQVIALTAETPDAVDKTKREWELPFPVVSDPLNVLQKHLKATDTIEIIVSGKHGSEGQDTAMYRKHPLIGKYEWGALQPAVLVLAEDGEAWFRWAIQPALMNMGGASDRPRPTQIVNIVKQKREGKLEGKVDAKDFALNFTGNCTPCVIV